MKPIHVSAPVNIALIKYWGKRDETEVMPYNGSLSLTLSELRTHTTLQWHDAFRFTLNGELQAPHEHEKLRKFMRHYLDDATIDHLRVDSTNDVPTAAGVASSASGYAAISLALKTRFAPNLPAERFHHITRLGSGSAVRSLYPGVVVWERDGSVYSLREDFSAYTMLVVLLSRETKTVDSRTAMRSTVQSSPYYPAWVEQAERDLAEMKTAILADDLSAIGRLMEANSLAMHASMMAASPPIHYLNDHSWSVLDAVREARMQGLELYATMDAGPNVKLLYRTVDETRVLTWYHQHFSFATLRSSIGLGAQVHDED
jgi:diphosphomevalonate decarboxylase